jgi:hypothetical protein
MNVENHNLAVRIFDALSTKGVVMGNASIYIIEKVLNDTSRPTTAEGARPRCKICGTTKHHTDALGYIVCNPPPRREKP